MCTLYWVCHCFAPWIPCLLSPGVEKARGLDWPCKTCEGRRSGEAKKRFLRWSQLHFLKTYLLIIYERVSHETEREKPEYHSATHDTKVLTQNLINAKSVLYPLSYFFSHTYMGFQKHRLKTTAKNPRRVQLWAHKTRCIYQISQKQSDSFPGVGDPLNRIIIGIYVNVCLHKFPNSSPLYHHHPFFFLS